MNEKQQKRYTYDTLSEAVNDLVTRGYTTDFLIQEDRECLLCKDNSLELSSEDFMIDEVYRFEGISDPGDESIVFAIFSRNHNVKGLVINSFGADFGYRSSKLVEHLRKHV